MVRSKSIIDLKIGEEAEVISFLDSTMACKLLTMGMMPNSKIKLIRKAPFGGAFYLQIDDHYMAIRTAEARTILVEEV